MSNVYNKIKKYNLDGAKIESTHDGKAVVVTAHSQQHRDDIKDRLECDGFRVKSTQWNILVVAIGSELI